MRASHRVLDASCWPWLSARNLRSPATWNLVTYRARAFQAAPLGADASKWEPRGVDELRVPWPDGFALVKGSLDTRREGWNGVGPICACEFHVGPFLALMRVWFPRRVLAVSAQGDAMKSQTQSNGSRPQM